MRVYVKLRDDLWLLVNRKIEQTTVTKKRKTTRYILAGESVDKPEIGEAYESVKIPRSIVNKVISRLIDVEDDHIVIIETKTPELCIAKAPKRVLTLVENIVKEITSARSKVSKTEEDAKSSSH